MCPNNEHASHDHDHDHVPPPGEPSIPELEVDQTAAPRPEEEIADPLRAERDVEDRTQRSG